MPSARCGTLCNREFPIRARSQISPEMSRFETEPHQSDGSWRRSSTYRGFRGGVDLVAEFVRPGADDLLQVVVTEFAVVKGVVARVDGVLLVRRGPLDHDRAGRLITGILLPKRDVGAVRYAGLNRPLIVDLRGRENSGLRVVIETVNAGDTKAPINMIGLELVRDALDVENKLVLLEAVRAQIVNQRKVCIRAARAIRRCAHIPGKIFPAVNLNPASLPPSAVWSGVDRFHQRPRC